MGQIVSEVKKEKLKRHLEQELPKLVSEFCAELSHYRSKEVLLRELKPKKEPSKDDKSMHILRRHLPSRTLWKEYHQYEIELTDLYRICGRARAAAGTVYHHTDTHTDNYITVALVKALGVSSSNNHLSTGPSDYTYEYSAAKGGVKCPVLIEKTPGSVIEDELAGVKNRHTELVVQLTGLKEMEDLVKSWDRILELSVHIEELAGKQLEENRIFYKCRYCKALWN